jgi:protocatechuate 3,4-dioxygenase beta subunit
MADPRRLPRRTFLEGFAVSAAAFAIPGAFAEALTRTPRQTQGPFYPDHLPLDRDNDLLVINDSTSPAVGDITHLTGRVLDANGDPVDKATVEIWQVDNNGVYLHSKSPGRDKWDSQFQGYGRFETASSGEYRFRTIKPVPYAPGSFQRTPHIHVAVTLDGHEPFTTQCYIKGHPMNEKDGVLRGIRDPKQRDSVLVDFLPIHDSKAGELAARFDIVLGFTPGDFEQV